MKDTTNVGNLSQAAIVYALMTKGYIVATPVGDGSRYDLIIDDGLTLSKIQCKTGKLEKGAVVFRCDSNSSLSTQHKTYADEVDYFAVWCAELKKAYLISVKDVSNSKCHLRIDPPANNQKAKVRMAIDYEL